MNAQRRFTRKIIYLVAIAVLLLPLSYLSQPGSSQVEGSKPGKLAVLRSQHGLSQANLGKVDPSSAAMRFATFGMHGLAASWLWVKANDAKIREDWTEFDATLDQIANFQPHFVEVWQFQAWNVAYNLSVRFDDYHDRYDYVRRGFKFMERGIGYNDRATPLPWDLAWFYGHKIGMTDERRVFRRLFREDEEYHSPLPEDDWLAGTAYDGIRKKNVRDNWLLAHWWYQRLADRKDAKEVEKPKRSETLFYRAAPHALIEYAQSLAKDGRFGAVAERAWQNAADAWQVFGNRPLEMKHGYQLRLLDYDVYRRRAVNLLDELDQLEPALKPSMLSELGVELTEEQQSIIDKSWEECTQREKEIKYNFSTLLWANPRNLLDDIDEDNRAEALRIIDRYELAVDRVRIIYFSIDLIAFESWRVRCEVERQDTTIAARQAIYQGNAAMRKAQITPALELYNEGIALWKQVLDEYPILMADWTTTDELLEVIKDYREILRQNDQPFPDSFPLQAVLDKDAAQQNPAGQNPAGPNAEQKDAAEPNAAEPSEPQPNPAEPNAAQQGEQAE